MKKAAKKPRMSAAAKADAAGPNPAAVPKSAGKPVDSSKALKQAKDCKAALDSFTPMSFWNGSVKPKDIDKRLHLAFTVGSSLQPILDSDPAATDLLDQLTQAAAKVSTWVDLLAPFLEATEASELAVYMQEMEISRISKVAKLPADVLHAMLVDLGRKLCEAWAWSFAFAPALHSEGMPNPSANFTLYFGYFSLLSPHALSFANWAVLL